MGGQGIEKRMKILHEAVDQQLLKPFHTHGWDAAVSSEDTTGEYIVVEAKKAGTVRRVALLYSSATDNRVYKVLDAAVDCVLTNGPLYMIESFAYGLKKPVKPVSEFFPVLVSWNKELDPPRQGPLLAQRPRKMRNITGENPLSGIWSRLDQFASVTLAEKLVVRRAAEARVTLAPEVIARKAEGVAFALRNASDYFRGLPSDSLNKRILALYYGTMALAFAEMLASPRGPGDLDEVEGMTAFGHGLYVLPSATGDFGGVNVGVITRGFFSRWAAFLGHDIGAYPNNKAKTLDELEKKPSDTTTTMRALLGALPEVGDLFLEVFENATPSWVTAVFPFNENHGGSGLGQAGATGSSYIHLMDASGLVSETTIGASGWPLAEITRMAPTADSAGGFRARVDHAGRRFWFEVLPVHHSPFRDDMTLILPVIGGMFEFRTIAMITLYALSILVRYMPSAWRRVEGGDWDQHLSLVKNAVAVFERVLPEHFLESIIGERIRATQPGHF